MLIHRFHLFKQETNKGNQPRGNGRLARDSRIPQRRGAEFAEKRGEFRWRNAPLVLPRSPSAAAQRFVLVIDLAVHVDRHTHLSASQPRQGRRCIAPGEATGGTRGWHALPLRKPQRGRRTVPRTTCESLAPDCHFQPLVLLLSHCPARYYWDRRIHAKRLTDLRPMHPAPVIDSSHSNTRQGAPSHVGIGLSLDVCCPQTTGQHKVSCKTNSCKPMCCRYDD